MPAIAHSYGVFRSCSRASRAEITSRAWNSFIRDRRFRRKRRPRAAYGNRRRAPNATEPTRPEHCDEPAGRVYPHRPASDRTVESDCLWLRWVLNWGVNERTGSGSYQLRENDVRSFDVPREKNPARPVASQDRFEAIRGVTGQVGMEIRWCDGRAIGRSWLSELFDLAMATGRRLSPIYALRSDDLDLGRGPFKYVRWRADVDKSERETVVPIGAEARAAIDRQLARRAVVGRAYLFPFPYLGCRAHEPALGRDVPTEGSRASSRIWGDCGMPTDEDGRRRGSSCRRPM